VDKDTTGAPMRSWNSGEDCHSTCNHGGGTEKNKNHDFDSY